MSVVDQNRKLSEIVLLGESFVCNLDESDTQLIGLVIDVLQFLKGLCALLTVRFVCPILNQDETLSGVIRFFFYFTNENHIA